MIGLDFICKNRERKEILIRGYFYKKVNNGMILKNVSVDGENRTIKKMLIVGEIEPKLLHCLKLREGKKIFIKGIVKHFYRYRLFRRKISFKKIIKIEDKLSFKRNKVFESKKYQCPFCNSYNVKIVHKARWYYCEDCYKEFKRKI